MHLPFLVSCELLAPTLYEHRDGCFQLMEQLALPPFMAGYGYLLVEHSLAQYLRALELERVTFEPAVLFNPVTKEEHSAHTRVRVQQFFRPGELLDLRLDGLRMLTLNDQYYFASPALKVELEAGPFPYLRFSEGLSAFAASAT